MQEVGHGRLVGLPKLLAMVTMGSTGKDRWQAKSLRSTFGSQCVSQLPTSPSCGFGSAIREATSRVSLTASFTGAHGVQIAATMSACCTVCRVSSSFGLTKCLPADVCFTRCGQGQLQIDRRQQLARRHLQSSGISHVLFVIGC